MSLRSSSPFILDFSRCFLIFKKNQCFLEKEAFNIIQELGFLSYYKDFKLLLYNRCFYPIFPSLKAFKSYLNKDLSLIPLKERKLIILQALEIMKTLVVSSYKENIELISLFIKYFNLRTFKELKVLDLFTCNFSSYSIILSNIRNIKRYF